ncbi:hypothetical protein COV11_01245 [Candidatus Woesearchaeota archaeon CG10_big_fil_rev_8_21_14_0_10_30_7]|nr:MAG: hypothetical protein COV11_01245 [Candidatus Woesearchaeota archaeon CG10_big_fil_rev_8_21_14_0_10_30_7]
MPPELNTEEQKVLNSIKALSCGLNSVANGIINCEEGTKKDGKVLFGDKTVSCESGVGEVQTLGKNENEELRKIALAVENCNKEKSYRLCTTFNTNSLGNFIITKEKIISKIKELGFEEPPLNLAQEITRKNPATFYVIKDTSLNWHGLSSKNEVLISSNMNTNYANFVRTGMNTPTSCMVQNFELPQRLNGDLKEWARNWITNSNDPKYLVYHEMFPLGEEKAWQIDKWGFMMDAVIYGGVVNGLFATVFALPGAATKIMNGLRKTSQEATELGLERATKEFGETLIQQLPKKGAVMLGEIFTKEGQERIIRSQILMKNLVDAGISREAAQEISEEALFKMSLYKLHEVTDPIAKFLNDDASRIINKLAGELPEQDAKALQQTLRSKLPQLMNDAFRNQLTKTIIQEMQDLASLKQFISKNLAKEGSKEISESVLKEFFEKILVNTDEAIMKSLGKEAEERLMSRSSDYFNYLSGDVGSTHYLTKILGQKMALSLSQQLDNIAGKFTLSGKESLTRLLTGKGAQELNEIYAKTTTKEGLKELIKQSPVQWRWWSLKAKDAATGTAVIKVPVSLVWSALASVKQTTTLTGQALQYAWENKIIKYALLYQIGNSLASIDAKNEKYQSKGNNNLVLGMPFTFENAKAYQLSETIKKYPVNLKKEQGHSRFFAASPCNANLKITKQMCSCELYDEDYVWEEDNAKTPIESSALVLKETYSDVYNSFKDQPEFEQLNQITSCIIKDFYGKECKKEIVRNKDVFDKFTEFLYNDFYIPLLESDATSTSEINAFLKTQMMKYSTTDNINLKIQEDLGRSQEFKWLFENILISETKYTAISTGQQYGENVLESLASSIMNIPYDLIFDIPKLTFEQFKEQLINNQIKYEFLKNTGDYGVEFLSPLIMIERNKLNNNYRNDGFTFSEQDKKSFLYKAAEKASFTYYIVKEKDLDLNKIAKNCRPADMSETTEQLIFAHQNNGRITTPCLMVEYQGIGTIYSEPNYCYSSDHENLKKWQTIFLASAITADVGVGVLFPPAAIPAAFLIGGLQGMADQMILDKMYWPNH